MFNDGSAIKVERERENLQTQTINIEMKQFFSKLKAHVGQFPVNEN